MYAIRSYYEILDILKEVTAWERGAFHFDETPFPFEIPSSGLISTQSVRNNFV